MDKSKFKLHILTAAVGIAAMLPLVLCTDYVGFLLLPLAAAMLILSVLAAYDGSVPLITAALFAAVSAVLGAYAVTAASLVVLASAAATAYGIAHKSGVFQTMAYIFASLMLLVAASAVLLKSTLGLTLNEYLCANYASAFPDNITDTLYRTALLTEYGGSGTSVSEYLETIMSLTAAEAAEKGGRLIVEQINAYAGQTVLSMASMAAVCVSLAAHLLRGVHFAENGFFASLGIEREDGLIPSSVEMSLPLTVGRIVGGLFVAASIAWTFGLEEAGLVTAVLTPLLLVLGITSIWFYLINSTRSVARSVVFTVLAALVCGSVLLTTSGLIDALTGMRRKYAEYKKNKEKKES